MKYCDTCHSAYPLEFGTCPKDQSPLRLITDLPPGMVLRGKYEVIEKIGAGGMGAVYKVRHLAFGELRALKVIGGQVAADPSSLARFRSEAVVARKLQHANAVRVEDLDATEDGRPFIVMEYVEGRNLRDVLQAEGAFAPARAAEIARQACSALAAAHALGAVHRDIKPENMVLVSGPEGDQVKILDFGLAKVREGAAGFAAQVATATNMVVGTPQYMPPERAMGLKGDQVDGRADLYSLGVVLYEMVTGELPFQSDTPMGMLFEHVRATPVPPVKRSPERGIPAPLSVLIMKAMEKEPERRFASAEAMGAALAAISTPLSSQAATAVVKRPRTPKAEFRAQFNRDAPPKAEASSGAGIALWIGGGLVAVVLAIGFLRRPAAPPAPTPAEPAVAPPSGSVGIRELPAAPTDDAIRVQVEDLVRGSNALRDARLFVEAANGIVTLTGEAPNATAAELAATLAGSVRGVRRVFSAVQVAGSPPPLAPPSLAASEPQLPLATPEPARPTPPAAPSDMDEVRRLLEEGRRQHEAGNPEGAEQAWEAVLRLDPNHPIARQALERLRSDRGRRPPPSH